MPNRFRVLGCFIERTGEASSVSGSLSESESNRIRSSIKAASSIPNPHSDLDTDTDPDIDKATKNREARVLVRLQN
jgi:hypothetical protein